MDQALQSLLYGYASYRHSDQPEHRLFNRMLQHFAQRVTYLCSLHSNGKLSADDFIGAVDAMWEEIERCKAQLDQLSQESCG
ncbi:MAG: hypothetical protein AAFX78_15725 [Cyanobacteria bacterium J06638_20]